jgi:hypothetical protein
MGEMMNAMVAEVTDNDLAAFKKWLDDPANGFSELVTDIKYGYSTPLRVYTTADYGDGETIVQVAPSTVFESAGMSQMTGGMTGISVWSELLDNPELLDKKRLLAISKCDLIDEQQKKDIKKHLPKKVPHIFISSAIGQGLNELKDMIWNSINEE